ncbi:helix-turn-helix domain-containing protein [Massilia terrae]|uniref:Helix-turn-helix domain-containing protein n=1 Tax=Massilia terrae TaxID=1811224 RepID=A0ABT2CZ63_9BURK|nr:helix-turn-helix domain-containing protein [Massilia terrae]MCS0658866.1 helix-turn-helix domain-containing protein [Massilia terrae]
MSHKATDWAWGLQLSPTLKFIMIALAHAADDDGICWPSIRRVAWQCSVSTRTVQRAIQEFTVKGLLIVTSRFSATGRQKSNGYKLQLDNKAYHDKLSASPTIMRIDDDRLSGTGVTFDVRDGGDNIMSPLEPKYKSSEQPPLDVRTEVSGSLHFPPALTTDERTAARSIVLGIDQEVAQALLDELSATMERRAIKTTPIQWLGSVAERARKGQFEPTGGLAVAARRQQFQPPITHQRVSSETSSSSIAIARAAIATAKAVLAKAKEDHDD